jgi:hypothetical protein
MDYGSNKDDNPLPLRRTFLLRGPEATYLLVVEIEQLNSYSRLYLLGLHYSYCVENEKKKDLQ